MTQSFFATMAKSADARNRQALAERIGLQKRRETFLYPCRKQAAGCLFCLAAWSHLCGFFMALLDFDVGVPADCRLADTWNIQ